MKKIIASAFLLVSVCIANAEVDDDSVAIAKKNSQIPTQRLSAAVPPCLDNMEAYFAAQRVYYNAAADKRNPDKPLSASQEFRRCP